MNYLIIALSVSVISNAVLIFTYYRVKKSAKSRPHSLEVNEFLLDLLNGEAMVKVSRVAPSDVFLRSPRNARS